MTNALLAQLLQTNTALLAQIAANGQQGPKHSVPKLDRFSKGDPQPWMVQIQNQFRACHVPEGDQYAHAVAALGDPAASLWNSQEQQLDEEQRTLEKLFKFLDSSGQLTRKHEAFDKLQELKLDPRNLEDSTTEFNRLAERSGAVYQPEGLSALYQHKVKHMSSPLCNEVMQQNQYDRYGDVLELQKRTAAVFQAQSHLLESAIQSEQSSSRKRKCSLQIARKRKKNQCKKQELAFAHAVTSASQIANGLASTSESVSTESQQLPVSSEVKTLCTVPAEKDSWSQRASKASRKPAARPAQQQVAKKQKHTAAAAPAGTGVVISGRTFYPSGVKRTEEERNILASDGRCFWCVQKGHQAKACPDKGKLQVSLPHEPDLPNSKFGASSRMLLSEHFDEIQNLSGKQFTVHATCESKDCCSDNSTCCSSLHSFLEADLAGKHVWINAPYDQLTEYVHKYKARKLYNPFSTSACIMIPKWHGFGRLCRGMRLLKEYRKGTVMFSKIDKQGNRQPMKGVPWDVQIFYDAPRPPDVCCKCTIRWFVNGIFWLVCRTKSTSPNRHRCDGQLCQLSVCSAKRSHGHTAGGGGGARQRQQCKNSWHH